MKVLVDTHCWLWALARPEALNAEAAALLGDGETEVVFSAASVWEIAIKSALGKLRVFTHDSDSLFDILEEQPITRLPILHSHARHVASLPPHHGDPFDRLLIAQAQIESLPIMTADDQFLRYEIEVIWAARQKPRRRRR
ncbi:MAG TPA: type II toxin-antitoxin system VapC family toxin [Gemmatimonadaceae bacterium]|nr:MAG: PIN domain nuclease [Acidobacteriota bacterium]HTD83727.1 type II toxin-antitoxin system VapC family toxin [Gemmatimonadaceae bacterium]